MIGQRIKEARIALGYSAEQVAAFLNVSPATVYRYENGDISKLPSKFVKPLAEYLCVSPSWLMGWTEDHPDDPLINNHPQTTEARIISGGIDKMPPERREQALRILQVAFAEYADYFKEKDDNDNT